MNANEAKKEIARLKRVKNPKNKTSVAWTIAMLEHHVRAGVESPKVEHSDD